MSPQAPRWLSASRKTAVALRILGTSPASSSLPGLLADLNRHLALLQGETAPPTAEEPLRLAQKLRQLLRGDSMGAEEPQQLPTLPPLLLLLDALEELPPEDAAAPSSIWWLPDELRPDVKLIVSAVAGSGPEVELRRVLPARNHLWLGPMGAKAAAVALDARLAAEGRQLAGPGQRQAFHSALTACSEPLFLRLLLDEARAIRSFASLAELPISAEAAIDRLLASVEARHGRTLVSRALALITASRAGLSEAELEDLLSLDDEVLNDVFQYHLPPTRRLPPLLWSRVRAELPSGLLAEAEADGARVLRWHHRQVRAACERRYFRNLNFRAAAHSALADFFLGR